MRTTKALAFSNGIVSLGVSLAALLGACSDAGSPSSPPPTTATGSGGSSGTGGTTSPGSGGAPSEYTTTGGAGEGMAGTGGVAGGGTGGAGAGGGTGGTGSIGSGGAGATGGSTGTGGSAGQAIDAGMAGAAGSTSTGVDAGPVATGFTRPKGVTPNKAMPASMINLPRSQWAKGLVSPTLADHHHHSQPAVINGHLLIAGNEEFWFYDVSDPTAPKLLSQFNTPNRCATCGGKGEGEAESHTISFARYGDSYYLVTTGGRGVDIWNITDATAVKHIKRVPLTGVDYGDYTAAVWGMFWQGDTIYVGSTDKGLDILDATDPNNVTWKKRLSTLQLGGTSAGPVDAIGNILVVATPKESAGISTLDISDPMNPQLLSSIKPSANSYIAQFYRHYVFMQKPVRMWDVLTDPSNLGSGNAPPIATLDAGGSEYLSFSDDFLFLGHLRPDAGVSKIDISDVRKMKVVNRVWGRLDRNDLNDDQFSIAIGNLLVMGDDQEPYAGSVIAVHSTDPDTKPPLVDTVLPRDKKTGVSVKTRIGISFTDNVEPATVNRASFIVRPVGGQALPGKYGFRMGVVNFDPDQDLQPKTTYEVVLPKGGLTDYVLNAIPTEFVSTFTTQ